MKRTLLLAGLGMALFATAQAQTLNDTRLRVSDWATGLNTPTTFTWIGPGEMLVIQKNNGRVIWIQDGAIKGTALDLAVQNDSERGGLGIAADPDFANNKYVYLYYSKTSAAGDSSSSSNWVDNRVERYDWNGSKLVNVFGPLVAFPTDPAQANGSNHDGGVIKFGPDGKLYGVTGDLNRGRFGGGGQRRIEQNTSSANSAFVGGMFRLETDGSIPADNPFVSELNPDVHLWFNYGLRNSFGLTFDEVTGTCWYTENGPNVYDEVNRCPSGMNSGWLKIMGPDSRDATYFENNNTSYDATSLTKLNNSVYLDPEFSYKTPTGITGIGFINSKRFPENLQDDCVWGAINTGDLYLGDMKNSRDSFRLPTGLDDKVADNNTERDANRWGRSFGGATDIQIGSDGYLYVVAHNNGKILQIRPITDRVEPEKVILDPALTGIGEPERLELSDDRWFRVAYDTSATSHLGRKPQPPPFVVEARFQLNEANPTAVTLTVESHYNAPRAFQSIRVWNPTTTRWEFNDLRLVGKNDVTCNVTLNNPAQYVSPTSLTIAIRIQTTPMTYVIPMQRTDLMGFFDLVRLVVTYP